MKCSFMFNVCKSTRIGFSKIERVRGLTPVKHIGHPMKWLLLLHLHKYLGNDHIALEQLYTGDSKVSPFSNCKDPIEILHTQALHQGLHSIFKWK